MLFSVSAFAAAAAAIVVAGSALGQDAGPPEAPDSVAQLTTQLAAGGPALTYEEGRGGYLAAVLQRLDVPEDSQVLVFSKTSLQRNYIGPKTPRAIYFNDRISVGFVPDAPLIEISALGQDGETRFYTIPAAPSDAPSPRQERGCGSCHATGGSPAPGLVVSSVVALSSGAVARTMTNASDARFPFADRWGGWYVTGRHGALRHSGNVAVKDELDPRLDPQVGLNVTELSTFFDTGRYRRPTSDIVALMTLEHQAGFTALANKLRGAQSLATNPADADKALGQLVDYMVGLDEPSLNAPVEGLSGFSDSFAQLGPHDAKGRSLREFDLHSRLFRYPLSYMIYSPAFDALGPQIKLRLYRRLAEVLSGADNDPKYARFKGAEGRAALEILAATKPGLPDFWPRPTEVAAR